MLTTDKLGESGGQFNPRVFFPKCTFLKKGEALVFVTFNIITRHNFPENFIEIVHAAQ